MKKALFIINLFVTPSLFAQSEFETYKNGLIYSEATMNKLERIVDSLNLKYKTCDFNKIFYSKTQTIGHYVSLSEKEIKEAKKDMDNNMPFDLFVQKYPAATIERNLLIVKNEYENDRNEDFMEYTSINFDGDYGQVILKKKTSGNDKKDENSWMYNYNDKSKHSDESLDAFFLVNNFNSTPLNIKYSRQIGYADCLIDTTTTKFLKSAKQGRFQINENWQGLSMIEKQSLLNKMRSTRVIGQCSQDISPRLHAMHIALLSAETTNWEVFLKSHLDIMNDRFERMTDGSYAYSQRKTYIKELEELDINVIDLLIGISLRVENPASNHYYGSIWRLGRAISESTNKQHFESQILSMIEDNELDDYNRVIACFLYINYNHYIEDKTEQKENIEKLKLSSAKLPTYISQQLKLSEK
jgi:hypothetical protein